MTRVRAARLQQGTRLSQHRGDRAPHTQSVCGREAGVEAAAMV